MIALFAGIVPMDKTLFIGTVPTSKLLFAVLFLRIERYLQTTSGVTPPNRHAVRTAGRLQKARNAIAMKASPWVKMEKHAKVLFNLITCLSFCFDCCTFTYAVSLTIKRELISEDAQIADKKMLRLLIGRCLDC
ncbi:hypothetical protein AVEN_264423-1 [Araneus ventricosus]|uniref:Uncharacterized protein n=1 Tax=Araneus ventricosus TaxID=182803 RepID=A0A4Y2HU87_ARAVE|nr:hypothetical protein AVEN_264423-1 [Araneus ventricosus]